MTRWREDATSDDWGSYVFLRDVQSGEVWSAGYQPSGVEPDSYDVVFNEDRAEITRRDGTLTTMLEVLVSAEDDAEVRRVSITNSGNRAREIDVTSYAELVLAPQADDVAHPAFMKLFVADRVSRRPGRCYPGNTAARVRRPSRRSGRPIWPSSTARRWAKPEVETDRARFLGRGRGIRRPIAVIDGRPLSNTVGTVLDPVFATALPRTGRTRRDRAHRLLDGGRRLARDCARPRRQASRQQRPSSARPRSRGPRRRCSSRHLGIDPSEAGLFQRSPATCCMPNRRCGRRPIPSARRGGTARGSGAQGISGDLPIVLVRIDDIEDLDHRRANCCRRMNTGG